MTQTAQQRLAKVDPVPTAMRKVAGVRDAGAIRFVRSIAPLFGATALVMLAGCSSPEVLRNGDWYMSEEPEPSATVVAIQVEHGAYCEQYLGVDVEESADRVRFTVRLAVQEPEDDAVCPEVLEVRTVNVDLDEPLGEREVTGPGHFEAPSAG